jgi:hypothetical protein
LVIISGVVLIIALVVIFEVLREPPDPTVETPPATATPTLTPTATASSTPAEFSSDYVMVAPTVTPTPWIPAAPSPRQPRVPTPTPSAAECIRARYTARQSMSTRATVHVEISATNRCRRVIKPSDVFFRVQGFRQGQHVQTAQGSPFEEIWPNRSVVFGIGLPGSIDWYDEITVEVLD